MSAAAEQPQRSQGPGLKERAREELRRFVMVSVYLFVCFAALVLYRDALLREAGTLGTVTLGFAAGKALILGKFLLLGEAAGVGSSRGAPTLLHAIVRKAVLLLVFLVVLSVLEELLVGRIHGHSFGETLAEYGRHSVLVLLAKCVLLLLALLPLVATMELSRALGPGVLKRMLLSARPRA
jgi:hypothetical protein